MKHTGRLPRNDLITKYILERDTDLTQESPEIPSIAAGNPVLTVELGYKRVNVGTLREGELYHRIYEALLDQCPFIRGRAVSCSGIPVKIEVDAIVDENRLSKSHFTVSVLNPTEDSYWGSNNALRRLMIGTVAGAMEAATWNPHNCLKRDGQIYCNMANFVSVIVPHAKDAPATDRYYKLNVRFTSDHAMPKSTFDCTGLLTPANGVVDHYLPEYQSTTGMTLERNVLCQKPDPATIDANQDDELDLSSPTFDDVLEVRDVRLERVVEYKGSRGRDLDSINAPVEASPQDVSDKTIRINIGGKSVNIGTLKGPVLYDEIYKALKRMCYSNEVSCDRSASVDIHVKEALLGRGGRAPGSLDVRVTVPNSYYGTDNALRRLLIGTVAGIFEAAVNHDKGICQKRDGKTFCNIKEKIDVLVPNGDSLMAVRFTGLGDNEMGGFDCDGILGDANRVVDALKSEYESVLHKALDRNVKCIKHCPCFTNGCLC